MRVGTSRFRRTGVGVLAALLAMLGLAVMAPTASAATGGRITAQSQPSIAAGTTGAAGNWTLTFTTATFVAGERIFITVDDSDGGANCPNAPDSIGFSGTPTATVSDTSGGTAATFNVTTQSASAACTSLGVKDQVVLTAATAGSATAITISGVSYTVGSGVALGPVTVTANGDIAGALANSGLPAASNATIRNVSVSGNNPAVAITANAGAQAISPLVATENAANALASGTYCFTLAPGAPGGFDTAGSAPTVAVSPAGAAGNDTSTAPTVISSTQVQFTLTNGGGANASTITVSGLRIVAAAATGPVFFFLSNCAGGVLSNTAVATSIVGGSRLGGADRRETAQAVAEQSFPAGTCNAIIARDDLFPDALAASYLAASPTLVNAGGAAPILLTQTASLSPPTRNALSNLRVRKAWIVGGTAAVSAAVEQELDNLPSTAPGGCPTTQAGGAVQANLDVERVGGADRFETAKLIAQRGGIANAGTLDVDGNATLAPLKTAILATGENFPDALAAGPLAFQGTTGANSSNGFGFPLLLTQTSSLSSHASGAFATLGIQQVIIVGGTAAVSQAVETALTGVRVVRLAGADRQGTAAAIGTFARNSGHAPGNNLAGSPAAAVVGGTGLNWAYATAAPAADPGPICAACTWGLPGSNQANVAVGNNFPDSLTAGPHGGLERGPIVLTLNPTTLSDTTRNWLRGEGTNAAAVSGGGTRTPVSNLHIIGGTAAVSAAVATEANNSLTGG